MNLLLPWVFPLSFVRVAGLIQAQVVIHVTLVQLSRRSHCQNLQPTDQLTAIVTLSSGTFQTSLALSELRTKVLLDYPNFSYSASRESLRSKSQAKDWESYGVYTSQLPYFPY